MLARYARREETAIILIGGGVTLIVAGLAQWWALLPLLVTVALLMFYRDPPRRISPGDDVLLAPADGKIMRIEPTYHPDGDDGSSELRIVIFLSVFNVHINRSPCAGRVTLVDYRPGEFLNALKPEATERNESNLLAIEPRPPLKGPVFVRQISGVLARRVVCTARPGDHLESGERFGMIKLGSQTELRVPADGGWRVCVEPGQSVRAGCTVLLRRQSSEAANA